MSYVSVSFGSEKKVSLVEVYCSFIISEENVSNTDAVTLGTFEERWGILVTYMENREVFYQISEVSDQKLNFETCIQKNQENLEKGEFALDGLQTILETKQLLTKIETPKSAPTLIASNINLLDREISTPDMEVVYGFIAEESSEEVPESLLENGLKQREEQYAVLWKEFTSQLKDSYLLQQNGISVLTKEFK